MQIAGQARGGWQCACVTVGMGHTGMFCGVPSGREKVHSYPNHSPSAAWANWGCEKAKAGLDGRDWGCAASGEASGVAGGGWTACARGAARRARFPGGRGGGGWERHRAGRGSVVIERRRRVTGAGCKKAGRVAGWRGGGDGIAMEGLLDEQAVGQLG